MPLITVAKQFAAKMEVVVEAVRPANLARGADYKAEVEETAKFPRPSLELEEERRSWRRKITITPAEGHIFNGRTATMSGGENSQRAANLGYCPVELTSISHAYQSYGRMRRRDAHQLPPFSP